LQFSTTNSNTLFSCKQKSTRQTFNSKSCVVLCEIHQWNVSFRFISRVFPTVLASFSVLLSRRVIYTFWHVQVSIIYIHPGRTYTLLQIAWWSFDTNVSPSIETLLSHFLNLIYFTLMNSEQNKNRKRKMNASSECKRQERESRDFN